MQPTPNEPGGSIPKIRGRRHLLFNGDIHRDTVWPLCMGHSRDWLMLLARNLSCPVVIAIDPNEATAIARRGVLPIDDTTIAKLAGECRCSKPYMADLLRTMVREAESARRARDESQTLVPGV